VHQEENLDEAVQLYEELLQYRTRESDPIGFARILANQGNALGHLGVFGDAADRLRTAQAIFAESGDTEAVATMQELLDGVQEAANEAGRGIA